MRSRLMCAGVLWLAALTPLASQATVTIDWIFVNDPGNACDPQPQGCFGSVAQSYRIAKHETSNAQYTEFLNAVAATDTNGLYDAQMGSSPHGGIIQSGVSGSFVYSVAAGFASKPVTFVSFRDAQRFANWLHNGQPTGAQGPATTEDGAYTFPAGPVVTGPPRNAASEFFVPSEDEWFKSAFYDPVTQGYFDYPAGSDTEPTCATPSSAPNTANCGNAVATVTDGGGYTGSPSPVGALDTAGNLEEWSEGITSAGSRATRGGHFVGGAFAMASSFRFTVFETFSSFFIGLRVAAPLHCPSGAIVAPAECGDDNDVSGDGCFSTCQLEEELVLSGDAQGGTVSVSIFAILSTTATVGGETPEQVLDALVAQINGNSQLQSLGVSALRIDDRLVTNGSIDGVDITDPGLFQCRAAIVPALSGAGLALLGAALGLTAALWSARRVIR